MKYSISALSDNLCSKKFESFTTLLQQGMVKENPELVKNFNDELPVERESVEQFISFSGLVLISSFLKDRKDFVIESDIVKDFVKGKHIKQDYSFTLKIPFPVTFISFDDPVEIDMVVPENYFETSPLNYDYNEWLENRLKEKLIKVKNQLFGIMIVNEPKIFNKTKEATINMQEKQKTMHEGTFNYYKTINPENTYKVYFIIDDLRMKRALEEEETKGKPLPEKLHNVFRNGFEFTNIIFDSEKLPEFISEFGLGVMNMTYNKNDMLTENFSMLLNLTIQIINFINSNDYVEQAPVWKSNKSKELYERKFGRSLPPEFYMLRVKYPKELMIRNGKGQPHSPYGYQFDVRGYFRHLMSPKFKHKRGQVIWIPSFKKGHGVYIQKRYAVVSEPDKLTQEHLKVEAESK